MKRLDVTSTSRHRELPLDCSIRALSMPLVVASAGNRASILAHFRLASRLASGKRPLPLIFDTTLEQVGACVTPIATIAIGMFMFEQRPRDWRNVRRWCSWALLRAAVYSVAKMLLLPAVALGIFSSPTFFAEQRQLRDVGVLLAAMPLAVSAFVFAQRFDADAFVMAASVVLTTLLTLPALLLWLWILASH